MESKELINKYPFKIVDLKTNSFSEVNLSEDEISSFNPDLLDFLILPELGFNTEKRLVKVNFMVSYSYKEKEILKIDVDTIFEFEEVEGLNLQHKTLLATVMGIAFSTIRGIILNRTIGSFLNNIYLPILNSSEIIEDIN